MHNNNVDRITDTLFAVKLENQDKSLLSAVIDFFCFSERIDLPHDSHMTYPSNFAPENSICATTKSRARHINLRFVRLIYSQVLEHERKCDYFSWILLVQRAGVLSSQTLRLQGTKETLALIFCCTLRALYSLARSLTQKALYCSGNEATSLCERKGKKTPPPPPPRRCSLVNLTRSWEAHSAFLIAHTRAPRYRQSERHRCNLSTGII